MGLQHLQEQGIDS